MQGNREKEGKLSSRKRFFKKLKNTISSERAVKAARSLARGSLSATAAFFFARCPLLFSSHPLGFALLLSAKRDVIYVLIGTLVGALSLGRLRIVYFCSYLAAILLRILINFLLASPTPDATREHKDSAAAAFSKKLNLLVARSGFKKLFFVKRRERGKDEKADEPRDSFCDTASLPSLLAATCASFAGVCAFILGGFAYYDAFALIFGALFAGCAAFIFSFLYEKELQSTAAHELAALIFCSLLVLSAKNANIFGISLGICLAFFLLLRACKRRSFLLALTWSALLGASLSYKIAPFFIIAALAVLILGEVLSQSAVFAGGAAVVLGSALTDSPLASVGAIGAVFLAGMAHLLLENELKREAPKLSVAQKLALRKKKNHAAAAENNIQLGAMVATQSKMEATEEKLRRMSESFESLSEIFFNLSDKLRRPAMLDLRKICNEAFDLHCTVCPKRDVCLGLEYGTTLEVMNRLTSKLHTRGRVEEEDVPNYLRSRCERIPSIVDAINAECARLTEEALRGERNEIFALDYSAISKILTDTVESEFESYRCDEDASTKIYDYLTERGHTVRSAVLLTGRRRQVILSGIKSEELEKDLDAMQRAFSSICQADLCAPTFEMRGSVEYAYFTVRKKIRIEHAALNSPSAKSGRVCGDSTRFFSTSKDMTFSLISDGMGSGSTAALTSGICAVFLEKMLSAGNKSKTSIRMINDLLRSRASSSALECSCSVDLAEIDLISASVSFTKCGAAPSFVIRNSKIYKIEADTAPIGILEAPNVHVTRFELRAGDVIIMVSDGAIADMNDGAFIDFLSENASQSASVQRLCELIMANAKICGSVDDVSCTVMKVYKN